ncbi:MAG: plasmid mobilization relaxosome protein MobC [Oscillospiraceae bacterium]|nr:plasmid mobilization relaxosome protein MobC [Oscillospiraceae bacterium]
MQNLTRNINIGFRVSEQERELIRQRQEQTGILNLRSYLLKMATTGEVIHLEVQGVHEMLRLLSNATNNINQIANRVNKTGNFFAHDLDDLRNHYEEIWGQVNVILRKLIAL